MFAFVQKRFRNAKDFLISLLSFCKKQVAKKTVLKMTPS
jgi:hypothetical protein